MIIENVEADPLYIPHRAMAKAAGYHAVQSTPLTGRSSNIVGVLSTHFRQPRQFFPWEIDLVNMHARHAADLIELLQTKTK